MKTNSRNINFELFFFFGCTPIYHIYHWAEHLKFYTNFFTPNCFTPNFFTPIFLHQFFLHHFFRKNRIPRKLPVIYRPMTYPSRYLVQKSTTSIKTASMMIWEQKSTICRSNLPRISNYAKHCTSKLSLTPRDPQ